MVKFLIIRFSSIGDIVLTTPVIRGLKEQVEGAEIHFLTKPQFAQLVNNNPHISKVHLLKGTLKETVEPLLNEEYDYIIDLHHNLRTASIKRKLPVMAFSVDKLNFKKWLLVNFKIDRLPKIHIVDRYMDTIKLFDVTEDGKGLDYFIPEGDEVVPENLHKAFASNFMSVVVGANHFTKQIPIEKLASIINQAGLPVCLLGGTDVAEQAEKLTGMVKVACLNATGKLTLGQSASVIKQCAVVLTPDTGLMHIASAFKKPVLSVWGNTVPAFGMYPYLPNEQSHIFETTGLRCRPCSKIGYKKCPKGHFKCMNQLAVNEVVEKVLTITKG